MVKEYAVKYFQEIKSGLDAIDFKVIAKIVDLLITALNNGNQIFVMGNGGSAATAMHFACDINKGVSYQLKKRFKVICLNENISTITAYSNDLSYEDVFVEQIKNFHNAGDLVIVFSGSGNSKNVIKAIEYANGKGLITIGFAGFKGGGLAGLAKIALSVDLNDMQKIEDLHLIVTHLVMQLLKKELIGQ